MKKYVLVLIGLLFVSFSATAQRKRKVVEVTCPSYSNATIVTYRYKKGTSKKSLKKKSKEEFLFFKRRGGKKFNSIVKMQAPKGKRFANDRKKTQKNILKSGLVRRTPKQNRPYHWNKQKM